jgi:hypothetical protein
MIATNALVTYTDLTTMGLTPIGTPPTGNQIATKQFIVNNYYVDSVPLVGYANNQCPPYQTISGVFGGVVSYGSTICGGCNTPTGTVIVSSNNTSFCNATFFYSTSFATFAAGNYVLVYGGNAVNISTNGTTTATMYGGGCGSCPSSTPVWTYAGYQTCSSCVLTNVYQDTAICSATYGYYKIGTGGTPQLSAPPNNTGQVCCLVLTCFTLTNNTTFPDGCNGTTDQQTVYTVTLKDQSGNPIAYASNITFEFSYDFGNVEDNPICESSGTAYGTLTVISGNTTGQLTFYPLTYQYCCQSSICDGSCYSYQNNITYLSNSISLPLC